MFQQEKNNGFWMIILLAVIAMLIVLITILWFENREKDQQLQIMGKNYINKSMITFEQLPQKIQSMYRLKSEKGELLELLQGEQEYLVSIQASDDPTVIYQDNEKIVFVKKMECTDMPIGSEEITAECEIKLNHFFKSFNRNMIYEVISLIKNDDLLKMGNIKQLLESQAYQSYAVDPLFFSDLVKYVSHGLGVTRLNLAISTINDRIPNAYIKISPFYFFTQNKSGFIIKAYNRL